MPTALEAIAVSLGMDTIDLTKTKVDPEAVDGFPVRLIHRYNLFPIDLDGTALRVATSNPFDLNAFDDV
ncbi:MAG: type II/IV secretion system protein, partial [Planctomycetaceae bacterium]|nr:type II/IV secretion system protein [Planctomycetaceae bacterium]